MKRLGAVQIISARTKRDCREGDKDPLRKIVKKKVIKPKLNEKPIKIEEDITSMVEALEKARKKADSGTSKTKPVSVKQEPAASKGKFNKSEKVKVEEKEKSQGTKPEEKGKLKREPTESPAKLPKQSKKALKRERTSSQDSKEKAKEPKAKCLKAEKITSSKDGNLKVKGKQSPEDLESKKNCAKLENKTLETKKVKESKSKTVEDSLVNEKANVKKTSGKLETPPKLTTSIVKRKHEEETQEDAKEKKPETKKIKTVVSKKRTRANAPSTRSINTKGVESPNTQKVPMKKKQPAKPVTDDSSEPPKTTEPKTKGVDGEPPAKRVKVDDEISFIVPKKKAVGSKSQSKGTKPEASSPVTKLLQGVGKKFKK